MTAPELEGHLEREHSNAYAWAVRCCDGDRTEAEEVLHLAYLKILEGRARFDGRSSFRTWLFGVIRRTAWEERRRGWTQRLRLLDWWRDRWTEPASPAVDDQVGTADEAARLRHCLGKLSRRQQEVLHLVFYQGLTVQEAAAVLGLPVGTARTHYERGKARLRPLLAAEGIER